MLFNLSTAWAQSVETRAAERQAEIKPLGIGDTIPEELWNLPLQVVNHPEGKELITLNDYRDKKLIILDFWATTCGSCREALPKLSQLQAEFSNSMTLLPITGEGVDLLVSFLKKNKPEYAENLLHVAEAGALHHFFPHRIVPHIVWISGEGKVINIGHGEYITAENIQNAIKKGELDIPIKIDYSDDLYTHNLITHLSEESSAKVLQSSILAGYVPFADINAFFDQDTVGGSTRYFSFNHSLNHLFAKALRSGLPLRSKRCIMNVPNPEHYIYGGGELFFQDWLQKYAFSYEAIVPYITDREEMLDRMKFDLERALGLKGEIRMMTIPCLVLLRRSDKSQELKSKEHSVVGSSSIVYSLNQNDDLPLVIDEVNDKEVHAVVDGEYQTVEELNNILEKYGLELTSQEREMQMFVLEEAPHNYTKQAADYE